MKRVESVKSRKVRADKLREDRERVKFARLCWLELNGKPYFAPKSDMLRIAFASKEFLKSEVEWLKSYEKGEV